MRKKQPSVGNLKGTLPGDLDALRKLWKSFAAADGPEAARERLDKGFADFDRLINEPLLRDKLPTVRSVADLCKHWPDWIEPRLRWFEERTKIDESAALFEAAEESIRREGLHLRVYRDGRLQVQDHGRWIKLDLDDRFTAPFYTIPVEVRRFINYKKAAGNGASRS